MHVDWTAIGAWTSVLVSLLVGAFVYGKLTQRVADLSEDMREVKTDVRDLKGTVQDQGNAITRILTHLKLDR